MLVEYEITKEDLFAFQWRAVRRSAHNKRSRRRAYFLWFVVFLLFAVAPSIGTGGFAVMSVNFVVLAVSFSVAALIVWYFEKRRTIRVINELIDEEKPESGQLGRHKIVLNASGIFESTDIGESRTSWVGVDRLEQNDEYMFIYTAAHAAYLIPKRAFPDSSAADMFWESMCRYKRAESS